MMPRKTHCKGHIVNFTYELKLFLILSNIHMSQMNKEKDLRSYSAHVTDHAHITWLSCRRGVLLTKSGKGKYSMYVRLCFSP